MQSKKIKELNLNNEPFFNFGTSLTFIGKMKLKINITHYKSNFFSTDIIFDTFESINIKEESHIYLNEKDSINHEQLATFFYVLDGDSIYFDFMKKNTTLGISDINAPNELLCYRVLSQNLSIDIITRKEPTFRVL